MFVIIVAIMHMLVSMLGNAARSTRLADARFQTHVAAWRGEHVTSVPVV